MGLTIQGDVYVDSSAALGIAQRVGSGKIRHVRVQALWVQEVKCNKRLKYTKVLGTRNPSDILTKHVPKDLLETHLQTLGVVHQTGRAKAAPSLDMVEAHTMEWKEDNNSGLANKRPGAMMGLSSVSPGVTSNTGNKKRVSFHPVISYRSIPSVGKCRKISSQHTTEKSSGNALLRRLNTAWSDGGGLAAVRKHAES